MGLVTKITVYCDATKCHNKLIVGGLREFINSVLISNNWHVVLHSNCIWHYCPDCYEKEKEMFENV